MPKLSSDMNSINGTRDLLRENDSVPLPPDVKMEDLDPRVYQIYMDTSMARAPSDWRPHDLTELLQYAKLCVKLDSERALLEEEGLVTVNRLGNHLANPRLMGIRTLENSKLAIARLLGFFQTAQDGTQMSKKAKSARYVKSTLAAASSNSNGLLASFGQNDADDNETKAN